MEQVNVLVGWSLPPPLMERISALDSRVHLLNDPYLELPRPDVWPPFPFPEQLLPLLPQAQVLFTSRLPSKVQSQATDLKWVQLFSAGADVAIREGLEHSSILFTTASGVHPIPISEWVIGAMLALLKRFPQAVHTQKNREYWKFIGGEMAGHTVGILGLGNIGLRVARICKALDMRVLGMRRSVTEPLEGQDPTDLLLPPQDLPLMLEQSDFLIICLPGTRETLGLLGERELQQMKQGSYLINVGRGGIVDEEALVRALRTGHLAGVALDVFAQEPLPPESPLWDEPGLLMTAHIAGNSLRYEERATDLFLENLRRYLEGQDLLNIYDPDRGSSTVVIPVNTR
jgi:phosphoglycerate dehydrogenase-like enzyme